MKSWLKSHWKTIAGGVCGAGAAVVAVAVNPIAGAALGAVCGAAFGRDATTMGRQLADIITSTLQQDKPKPPPTPPK